VSGRRWTPRAAASRALELLREQGVRAVWFGALAELGYRRLLVTEVRLPGADLRPSELPLTVRFLEPGDAAGYRALRAGGADELERRLATGDRCFGAWLDGRLVSVRWFSSGTAWIEYLDRRVPLRPGELYLYDLYTAPDVRGRSVSRASAAGWQDAFAAEGVRRLVGTVLPENRPVLRATEKAGWRVVGKLGYVRIGPWRRDFGGL
jgi:hypothetical protein